MEHVIPFCHRLLKERATSNSTCVDFTMGNGHDTLFLSQLCPTGRIYSFDIQPKALENTQKRLEENLCTNVTLILDSHENFPKYLAEQFFLGVFNLGYLPGENKEITTKPNSTLNALKKALEQLSSGGLIVLVVYSTHPGGQLEATSMSDFTSSLSDSIYQVIEYKFTNKPTAPFVIAIEKK